MSHMTVNELIAQLSALTPEERDLPVLSSFANPDRRGARVLHDPDLAITVEDVRTDHIIGAHPWREKTTVRALRIF